MSIHKNISNKISNLLNHIYFKRKKDFNSFFVFKIEYFIYLQYYFIYDFLYNLKLNNYFLYSISLQLIHLNGLIFDNLKIDNEYNNNIIILKDNSYNLLFFLLFLKGLITEIKLKNIFLLIIFVIFFMGLNINYVYKERLQSIKDKKEFNNLLKILIISPDINFIKNIIRNTENFNYCNFFLLINFLLFF